MITEKDVLMKKGTKLVALVGIIFFFALIINISESRGINDIGGSFYGYFTCSIPLCNEYLVTETAKNHMYGVYSFKGFLGPIFTVLNYVGISTPKAYLNAQNFAILIENNYLTIGNNSPHTFNSFIPAGASLYVDGGYLFEFVVMIVYGWISEKLFYKVKNISTRNSRNLSLFIYFMIGISLSFMNFWFVSYKYALAVVYLLLLYKNKTENNKVKKEEYLNEYSKSDSIVSSSVSSC
jgi:hypothetical protein